MKQEDKQLLLVDLCSRLPYNVKCQFEDTIRVTDGESDPFYDYILSARNLDLFINHKNFYIKPYLRPMSSMTEEERAEFYKVGGIMSHKVETDTYVLTAFSPEAYDWLNKHHFDYRELIPKGLAIKAPEEIYNK